MVEITFLHLLLNRQIKNLLEYNMRDYEQVCKHVGKLVLDFQFEIERVSIQFKNSLEEFKKVLDEKNSKIKELEQEIEKLRNN